MRLIILVILAALSFVFPAHAEEHEQHLGHVEEVVIRRPHEVEPDHTHVGGKKEWRLGRRRILWQEGFWLHLGEGAGNLIETDALIFRGRLKPRRASRASLIWEGEYFLHTAHEEVGDHLFRVGIQIDF